MREAFCCWSGGKDCSLALYRAKKMGVDVSCVFNMKNSTGRLSRSHGISSQLLQVQAESMNIPIVQQSATWNSYENRFKSAVKKLKSQGVETGIFGDIDLDVHREWVERVCQEIGIEPVLPLWGQAREDLLKDFIASGFKAVVVALRADLLGKEWLGREIDSRFMEDMAKMENIDLCGEGGEFHTFVYDGPIFKRPVEFVPGKKVFKNERWFLQL